MKTRLDCGCELEETETGYIVDVDTLHTNKCPLIWELAARGALKGIFQIETSLGRTYSKKAMPKTLGQVAALTAIIRPGTLKAIEADGKSATEHYCLRANNLEPVSYLHPSLEPYLKETFGIIVFQEQIMKIAGGLAGYNEVEQANFLKGVAKKLPEVVAAHREKFTQGCVQYAGMPEETATQLFETIQKSNRYAFNKAHSLAYGCLTVENIWCKAHFPLEFYVGSLVTSHTVSDPLEDIRGLINEARGEGIETLGPDLRYPEDRFFILGDSIHYGLDIKGIGRPKVQHYREALKTAESVLGRPFSTFSWYDYLIFIWDSVTSTFSKNLIRAGAFACFKQTRQGMLFDASIWDTLTNKQKDWCVANARDVKTRQEFAKLIESGAKLTKEGGACKQANYIKPMLDCAESLRNPPYALKDSPQVLIKDETELLGLPISISKLSGKSANLANCTVSEFQKRRIKEVAILAEIVEARAHKVKNGKNAGADMGFLVLQDETGVLEDVVMFSEPWEEFANVVYVGNTVLIQGERDRDRGGLIVKNVVQV